VSPDCKYKQTTVSFDLGPEKFSLTGKVILSPGFTTVMHWQAISSDESMPTFKVGDKCPVHEVGLQIGER
jgi:DNA topoisomerase-3